MISQAKLASKLFNQSGCGLLIPGLGRRPDQITAQNENPGTVRLYTRPILGRLAGSRIKSTLGGIFEHGSGQTLGARQSAVSGHAFQRIHEAIFVARNLDGPHAIIERRRTERNVSCCAA